jgi:hypothetical protein
MTSRANPAEIIHAVDARMRARYAALGLSDADKPEFGLALLPNAGTDDRAEMRALHAHLRRAYDAFRNPPVRLNLASSPATRLPLIGGLWARVRAGVHKLPLYYVHETAMRQVRTQRALLSALALLTTRLQRQRAALAALRSEAALRDGAAR